LYQTQYREEEKYIPLTFSEPLLYARELLEKVGTNADHHYVVINSQVHGVWWSRGLNETDIVDLREINHFYLAPTA
jgi:hypothetical protein